MEKNSVQIMVLDELSSMLDKKSVEKFKKKPEAKEEKTEPSLMIRLAKLKK